jgi:hypothetical protein
MRGNASGHGSESVGAYATLLVGISGRLTVRRSVPRPGYELGWKILVIPDRNCALHFGEQPGTSGGFASARASSHMGSSTGPARDSIATDSGLASALGSHGCVTHRPPRFYYRDAAKRFHFLARINGGRSGKPSSSSLGSDVSHSDTKRFAERRRSSNTEGGSLLVVVSSLGAACRCRVSDTRSYSA